MTVDAALLDRVRDRLVRSGEPPEFDAVASALRVEGTVLGAADLARLVEQVRSELVGAGPLQPLLADPTVTDVLVSGPSSVWVDRGDGLEPAGIRFADDEAVRRLAQRLAAGVGRRLDDAQPFVDARTPDGTRLHAVLSPVARTGTAVALRLPRRAGFDLPGLVAAGSIDPVGAEWLAAVIGARLSFLISGGTGTGKTTVLSALLGLVPANERVLILEDSAELVPDHPHVVALEARGANVEGAGQVSLTDLVRQSLRMRPDRIVVGEVRGVEVIDLLAAMNTGHEGGCGTVHANSAAEVPARLTALAAPAGWDSATTGAQAVAGLDAVIHLVRVGRRRRVAELAVFGDGLPMRVIPALRFGDGEPTPGPGLEQLRQRLGAAVPR